MSRSSRSWQRSLAVLATAVAVLVAFGALGGVGSAKSKPPAAQGQYGKTKVTVCHKGKKTIKIALAAWPAHKRHGDALGQCTATSKQQYKAWKKAQALKKREAARLKKAQKAAEKAKLRGEDRGQGHGDDNPGKGKGKGKSDD